MRSAMGRYGVSTDTCDGSFKGGKRASKPNAKNAAMLMGWAFSLALHSSRRRHRGAAGLPVRRGQRAHLQDRRKAQACGPVRLVSAFNTIYLVLAALNLRHIQTLPQNDSSLSVNGGQRGLLVASPFYPNGTGEHHTQQPRCQSLPRVGAAGPAV